MNKSLGVRITGWLLFIIGLGVAAFLTFRIVRGLTVSWEITDLGIASGFTFLNPTPTPQEHLQSEEGAIDNIPETPVPQIDTVQTQPWDGADRVTVLIMGLDLRDWEAGEGAPRTDTMILLTLDPLSKTAGMLSIPRDLYVSIPGFQYERINTAYRQGEVYQLPGGGPALATETVEQLLGVPIDFYAQVDFGAFVRMIDEMGGLKVDVQEPIEVDPIGPGNHKFLQPGVQTLPGDVALAYARARSTEGGDFDRAQRQQQVILAIRARILKYDLIPVLISKAPVLYREISSGVKTNMSLEQALRLALLAQEVSEENIRRGIIGTEHIIFYTTPEGDQVLKPIPDKIRQVRDEVFGTFDLTSPLANLTPEERIQAENARIRLLNGTFTEGLATKTAEYLNSLGTKISEENLGNAVEGFPYTTVTIYTGKPYTVGLLVETLNVQFNRIFLQYDPDNDVDVEVSLGNDWAANNPLP
jgi:LCP family protein required for cell wall assembly